MAKIQLKQTALADVGTVEAGKIALFIGDDGKVYKKDSDGNVTQIANYAEIAAVHQPRLAYIDTTIDVNNINIYTFKNFSNAFEYLEANEQLSETNRWIIKFSGTHSENLTESFAIPQWVYLDGGNRDGSILSGLVDFKKRGTDYTSIPNKIINCTINNLAITQDGANGKGMVFENVRIKSNVKSGTGHYLDARNCWIEGDFSNFTGGSDTKRVFVNCEISAWDTTTIIPGDSYYFYNCLFGSSGKLYIQGKGWNGTLIKDSYFENWGTTIWGETSNEIINLVSCDFITSGVENIILCSVNASHTNFRNVTNIVTGRSLIANNCVFTNDIVVNYGATLITTDSSIAKKTDGITVPTITNNGTWTNKGGLYNNANSKLSSTDVDSAITELAGQIIKVGEINYTDLNTTSNLAITQDGANGKGMVFENVRIKSNNNLTVNILFTDAKPINKLFVRGYMVIDESFAEDYYYYKDYNIVNVAITEEPVEGSNIPNSAVRDIKCSIRLDGNNQDWIQGKASIYIEVVPFPTLTE